MLNFRVLYNRTEFTIHPTRQHVEIIRLTCQWMAIWLGYIDISVAKAMVAHPCPIRADAHAMNEHFKAGKVYLEYGEYVHASWPDIGVYGAAMEGVPRVVR